MAEYSEITHFFWHYGCAPVRLRHNTHIMPYARLAQQMVGTRGGSFTTAVFSQLSCMGELVHCLAKQNILVYYCKVIHYFCTPKENLVPIVPDLTFFHSPILRLSLCATESWAGPGNDATFSLVICMGGRTWEQAYSSQCPPTSYLDGCN